MKKNKNKHRQKKRQQRQLKSNNRRKEYLKDKRTLEECIIVWDDFTFLSTWKSLSPSDLMENCFQFNVDEWIYEWVRPRKLRDFNALHDPNSVWELLQQTFTDTLDAWAKDTQGFTEIIPQRWQYNEKNQNKFVTIMMTTDNETIDYTEEEVREVMDKDRAEWFGTVFNDMIDEMVNKLVPYVILEVKSVNFQ